MEQRLIGKPLPDVELAATGGSVINPAKLEGLAVIFCYPWTGRPGHPDPPGWDAIPGAHGSTPQALAYSNTYEDFLVLGVKVFGLSLQESEWQQEFAPRNRLAFPLLSDVERKFSSALGLPVFGIGGADYLKRITFITRNGAIEAVRFPVLVPEKDAEEVLVFLRNQT